MDTVWLVWNRLAPMSMHCFTTVLGVMIGAGLVGLFLKFVGHPFAFSVVMSYGDIFFGVLLLFCLLGICEAGFGQVRRGMAPLTKWLYWLLAGPLLAVGFWATLVGVITTYIGAIFVLLLVTTLVSTFVLCEAFLRSRRAS